MTMNFKNHAFTGVCYKPDDAFDVIPTGIPLYFRSSVALWLAMLQAVHKQITIISLGSGLLAVGKATKLQKSTKRFKYPEAC